jgi:fatty-acyl-CoA synthase
MSFLLGTHRCGGAVYVMEKFDATRAIEALMEYQISHSQWVPTMFSRMLALDSEWRARLNASSHLFAIHGAAPCPVEVKRAMMEWWGPIVWEYYAGTEGPGSTVISPHDWLVKPGSVGRASAGRIHILSENGVELAPGEIGGVFFESPSAGTFEYYGDAAKTKGVRSAEGYSTMGDVGYLDDDGYLYLTDRKAFTIISGGVNIYPQESENVLVRHAQVRDVVVFGVPDSDLGEVPHAVVELEPGVEASDQLAEELLTYCREHLSSLKCPRTVSFVASLQRAETGKVSKALVRDQYLSR